jgi:hypothetical protein
LVSDNSVDLPKIKFQTVAVAKGFYTVMKESSINSSSTQEEFMDMSDEKQSKKEKRKTLNRIPIAYLTIAFESQNKNNCL